MKGAAVHRTENQGAEKRTCRLESRHTTKKGTYLNQKIHTWFNFQAKLDWAERVHKFLHIHKKWESKP